MKNTNTLVAFYATHQKAEIAIKKLEKSGYDMTRLSIIGTDYHSDETVTGYYTVGDRMKKWGSFGAFWGGFWGLLFGSAFFFIPGLGPLLVAGPLVSAIIGALEGAALLGGSSVIAAALVSLGIPNDEVLKYETQIKAGKFMLLAHGSKTQTENARKVLGIHIPKENGIKEKNSVSPEESEASTIQ
ncbi:general stress protein [Flavobacterium sp. FlaQc-48]|uniref:general stress protein n=1 Tax=Flavobacterium sp. FlaQc-48 TaxID=3374181 RepID=UPI003756CDB0